jgi:dTDP-4-dehydrorhamnose reductase
VNPQRLLILGASGLVGRKLYSFLKEKGHSVFGTYSSRPRNNLQYFDLSNPDWNQIPWNSFSHVILSSAITNIEKCFLDQKLSKQVNVTGLKQVLDRIKKSDAMPIFISTDYVFDGIRGNYREMDDRNPETVYGRQKKEIEDYIIKEFESFLILRLGKVVSVDPQDRTFLTDWFIKMHKHEKIQVAEDQISSLLEINDMLRCFQLVLDQSLKGLYHIACGSPSSKLEIAQMISKRFNLDSSMIIPCRINALGLQEKRPLNTSLNSEKFVSQADFQFKKLQEIIHHLKNHSAP